MRSPPRQSLQRRLAAALMTGQDGIPACPNYGRSGVGRPAALPPRCHKDSRSRHRKHRIYYPQAGDPRWSLPRLSRGGGDTDRHSREKPALSLPKGGNPGFFIHSGEAEAHEGQCGKPVAFRPSPRLRPLSASFESGPRELRKKARLGERAWGKEETCNGFSSYLFFFFAFFAAISVFPSFC